MMNFRKTSMALGATLAFAAAGYSAPASAQATRTWVSGVGDDVNPCSRTAPCKTFAGAISKTAAGGEINCLDPGGFGGVTVTKSITIDCTGTLGGQLAASTTGVTVNAAGIQVMLRSLSINGGTPALTGLHGIRYLQGSSLTVENVIIQNFNSVSAGAGNGITYAPSAGTNELYVTNTTIIQNGSGSTTAGIEIAPTGGAAVRGTLSNVRIMNNNGAGLSLAGDTILMLVDSVISHNVNFGILTAAPGSPVVRVADTTITGNGTGIALGAGEAKSYGNNRLNGNSTEGAFTLPNIAEQ